MGANKAAQLAGNRRPFSLGRLCRWQKFGLLQRVVVERRMAHALY